MIEPNQTESIKEYWKKPGNKIALITLFAVLSYTGIQAYQTHLIASNNVVSQRAFVFKRQIDAVPTLDKDGNVLEWRIAPLWENSGATGTKTLIMAMDCPKGTFNLSTGAVIECPEPNIRNKTGFYPRFLGPHQTSHDEGSCNVLTPAQVEATPDHRFFMWAYARYTDMFDKSHKTRFCQGIILSGNPYKADGLAVEPIIAQGGNCTDEICDEQDRQAEYQDKKSHRRVNRERLP